jgi:YegS/Rv2252/BmrU family lipid kinase
MRRRAVFFVNRSARRGAEKIAEAAQRLTGLGFELHEESTYNAQHLQQKIREHRDAVDVVIIGGGDGTLNGAVDALVETDLPLGILPLGTANDLAATLGLPTAVSQACEVIAAGCTRRIDVGRVNDKHFLNEAGLGLSARLARRLTQKGKGIWGTFAVGASACKVLSQAKPFAAEVRYQGKVLHVETMHLMVGNGRNFGGWITNREASIDDRMLDLYSFEIKQWSDTLAMGAALIKGRYADCPAVRLLHGPQFEISTASPRAIDTDGELTTRTPALFCVVPHALSVFVPAAP